jgi:hypothetical protein
MWLQLREEDSTVASTFEFTSRLPPTVMFAGTALPALPTSHQTGGSAPVQ